MKSETTFFRKLKKIQSKIVNYQKTNNFHVLKSNFDI